jgi:ATP-dependent DNA helicase RecG
MALAEPVRSTRRSNASVTRRVILALCRDRFLSLRQLSHFLARGQESLRDDFISPMVKERALELRYPDKPSRRDQAYRASPEPPERVE